MGFALSCANLCLIHVKRHRISSLFSQIAVDKLRQAVAAVDAAFELKVVALTAARPILGYEDNATKKTI